MRRSSCFALLPLAALLGCDDAAPTADVSPVRGYGTPRQLVYVSSNEPIPKHGGATDTPGSVHVFERDTFERVGYFAAGRGVAGLGASADGSFVWAVNSVSGTVTFFDTRTYDTRTITLGIRPNHSFITPDHASVWIGNDGSASVSIIHLADLSSIPPITTGAGHHKVAFATDTDGSFVRGYVSNIVDGTVTPVSPTGVTSTNVTGTGFGPHGIDYSSVSARVYDCTDSGIDVIATRDEPGTPADDTNTVVARIPLPARCSYLHVEEDGTHALATLATMALLVRLDVTTHQLETFPVASDPDQVLVTGDHAFVASLSSPVVSFVDFSGAVAATNIEVGRPTVGADRRMTLDGNLLFVPNSADDSVSIVDVGTLAVVSTLTGIEGAASVVVAGPEGGTVYPR